MMSRAGGSTSSIKAAGVPAVNQSTMQAAYPPPAGPPPQTYTDQDAQALLGDQHTRWSAPAPQSSGLPLPVCLPQVAATEDAAFARGYNDQLMACGITMSDWLKFIDALNNAMVRFEIL
jgi:hypothetical protein